MIDEELAALEAVQFNWAVTPEDVWSPVEHHVDGLHERAARALWTAVPKGATTRSSPVGVVLQGEKGVGKTHMLRWLRHRTQEIDGYFFLLRLMEGDDFWRNAVHGVLDGFQGGQLDQLSPLLRRLATLAGLAPLEQSRISGTIPVSRDDLDALVAGIRKVDAQVWSDCQDTLRALVLFRADRPEVHEIGNGYLSNDGDVEDGARVAWGFRPGPARSRQLVLRDLSRLLALTGPTVLAVDQIDPFISHSGSALHDGAGRSETIGTVADGLMELREITRRTLTVVACLPASWAMLTRNAVASAEDRFRVLSLQGVMPNGDVPRAIVGQHLGGLYAEAGFTPPYPTWPVRPEAFDAVGAYTPRRLLQAVSLHVRGCIDADRVHELTDLADSARQVEPAVAADPQRLRELDRTFDELRAAADVTVPLDQDREDQRVPSLLAAGLRAWVAERGDAGQPFTVDPVRARRPPVHARLRHTLDETTEAEAHYAFRAIAHSHHRAVQSRLAAARTEAGLGGGSTSRRLVLLRNRDWPSGKVTAQAVNDIEAHGGIAVPVGEADLRTLSALEVMQHPLRPGWHDWLVSRRPAASVEIFRRFLPAPVGPPDGEPAPAPSGTGQDTGSADPEHRDDERPAALVGVTDDDRPVTIPIEALRKHTAVFAGSGSGKTVLLRRLIEESALQGVSSIVLDINNDLSRLGDAWPEPPPHWIAGDAERASRYLDGTDVVIWTPGRTRGRPLSFRPLPDFAAVLDDEDEFRMAVDAAVSSLAPHTGLTGRKVAQGEAVLRETVGYFARQGGTSLGGLIALLEELPDGLTSLRNGPRLASEMSDALRAATINDPLLGGAGEPLDPGVLLTPADGARARVSVISFVGLPTAAQRESFVNQLQMALFSWIKANPAGPRPLGGLFVMDEAQNFASSGAFTACTASTIALASQARKYGLGLVFATQAPKGLHNHVSGNSATQFFGFLNAPAQIAAAKDLARAKSGNVDDISRLGVGQFYLATAGGGFSFLRVPQCLSHHPPSPPNEEEVLRRACGER
ncbi:ATP-binding protein [Pseudonocardia nematodicida]|uniref:ATP-binding protein n=1 Tax=Pseudonocardia nematodicida TaxID=1206997 RepID=A0ABV1KEV1_9PSEU